MKSQSRPSHIWSHSHALLTYEVTVTLLSYLKSQSFNTHKRVLTQAQPTQSACLMRTKHPQNHTNPIHKHHTWQGTDLGISCITCAACCKIDWFKALKLLPPPAAISTLLFHLSIVASLNAVPANSARLNLSHRESHAASASLFRFFQPLLLRPTHSVLRVSQPSVTVWVG
jgi:hypothetical protein